MRHDLCLCIDFQKTHSKDIFKRHIQKLSTRQLFVKIKIFLDLFLDKTQKWNKYP